MSVGKPPELTVEKVLHKVPGAETCRVLDARKRPLVAKIFRGEDSRARIEFEAENIETVHARCGDVTPALLGVYSSPCGNSGVLLMEDRGDPLKEFAVLSDDDRCVCSAVCFHLH